MSNDKGQVSAQVASRPDAQLTAQIVIMEEPWVRDVIEELRLEFGVSKSIIGREALRAGLPIVAKRRRLERAAIIGAALNDARESADAGS